jgi:hypothetical protein
MPTDLPGAPGPSGRAGLMPIGGTPRALLLAGFERAPFWVDGPYEFARRYAVPLLRVRHPLRRLVGTARDGRTAAVLVAGRAPYLDDLARGFFAASPAETPVGTVSGFGLARTLTARSPGYDLVLAHTYALFAREAQGFLRLPEMPDLRLRVDKPEAMLAAANRTTRDAVRQCDEAGYRVRLAYDPQRFALFYHDYYLPFVRQRHGREAVVHSPQVVRRRLRRGGISWVEVGGKTLFATAFKVVDDTFRELVSGTPHGRYDIAARRAQYASRAEHMRLAHQAGLRWLNMGGGRPWLSDGMLAFKRAWGGELAERPDGRRRDVLVGWRRCTPAVQAFLAAYPLVVRDGDGFSAVAAFSPAGPADPDAALASWRLHAPGGLRRLHVVSENRVAWAGLESRGARREARLPGPAGSAELRRIIRDAGDDRPGEHG